jgi:flagellar motor switch protein FliM
MMNIAMPSIVIKMMRQKFDQQWSVRKTHANAAEQVRILRMLRESSLTLEARLEGPTLSIEDLLGLSEGHLLTFDYPVDRPVELLVNGIHKYTAQMVSTGRKRACLVEKVRPSLAQNQAQGKISEDAPAGLSADSPG